MNTPKKKTLIGKISSEGNLKVKNMMLCGLACTLKLIKKNFIAGAVVRLDTLPGSYLFMPTSEVALHPCVLTRFFNLLEQCFK